MQIFKYASKFYFKNIFLCASYILFFGAVIVYSIIELPTPNRPLEFPLFYLENALTLSIFVFVFFLFISYEYFRRAKSVGMEEGLKCVNNGTPRLFAGQLGLMILLDVTITLVLFFFNLAIYLSLSIHHQEYLLHIILNLFLNVFLISLFGILMGALSSLLFNQISAYLIMVFFIFLSTPIGEIPASQIQEFTGFNAYAFHDFFNIFSPSLSHAPNQHFGYSLLSYRWELLAFWIFLMLALLLIKLAANHKQLYRISSTICIVLCMISLACYFQPASKIVMNYDPYKGVSADAYYYFDHEQKQEQANFSITGYKLDLTIKRELVAKTTIMVDKKSLPEYKLTLYRGYKITKVTDQSGEKLAYSQDGDYLAVKTNTAKNLEQLTLYYHGSAPKFYANGQGAFLSGQFPYYPHSGYHPIFDNNTQGFYRLYTPSPVSFDVSVKSSKQMFCNLPELEKNRFSGISNGVTLMSGFLDSCEADGLRLIYPYLNMSESQEQLESRLKRFKKQEAFSSGVKTIFIMPNMNFTSPYDQVIPFIDHINLNYLEGITNSYQTKVIDARKLGVAYAADAYITKPEEFEQFAKPLEGSESKENSQNYYYLLSQKLKTKGREEVLAKVDKYLNDSTDQRSSLEFLEQL